MTVVRCASHRARSRLFAALARKPRSVWSFDVPSNYGCYEITAEELTKARAVKGITVPRYAGEWFGCWS